MKLSFFEGFILLMLFIIKKFFCIFLRHNVAQKKHTNYINNSFLSVYDSKPKRRICLRIRFLNKFYLKIIKSSYVLLKIINSL